MNDEQTRKLAAPLDAARVKQRKGRGGGPNLSYLETHDVIRAANDIFGFGGWGHTIVELRLLPGVAVKNKDGKDGVHVGYVCVVQLTVAGSVPVSGVGYGDAVEYTQSAPVTAHELAAKEAESDALKRALKNYGDQFGLALYDKHAASSGHVARGGSDGNTAPVFPPTQAALAEFEKVAEAWRAKDASFDLGAALVEARKHDAAWLVVARKKLQSYIDERLELDAAQETLPVGEAAA